MTGGDAASTVPDSAWFKSSYSGGGGGECVEVAVVAGYVHVRDSKKTAGAVLTVTPGMWSGLVGLASGRGAQ